MDGNHIVTALCNLFLIFVIWQFYDDMFQRRTELNHLRWIFGGIWYVATYVVSEIFHSAIMNIMISIVCLFLLLVPYQGTLMHKVLAVFLVECINSACDYAAYSFFLSKTEEDVYAISYVGTVVLAAICENMLRGLLQRRKGVYLEGKWGFILSCVPVSLLLLMYCQFSSGIKSNYLIISGVCTLVGSFVSFSLYNIALSNHFEQVQKDALDKQISAYSREMKRIEETGLRIDGIRHDLRHHVIEMESLVDRGETQGLKAYLQDLKQDLSPDERLSQTGNYEIDSLINYLLGEAQTCLKNVDIQLSVPNNLDVSRYQLTVILGNLLENAIEASMKSEEQYLSLSMRQEINILYIDIENSFSGRLNKSGTRFSSTKTDKRNHGLGLSNVERVVRENGGELSIETDNQRFRVNIMVFL